MRFKIKVLVCSIIFFINSFINAITLFSNCDDNKSCPKQENCIPCAPRQLPCPTNSCNINCSSCCYQCGTSTYIPRSVGDNIVREGVGLDKFAYKYNFDQNYTNTSLAVEYSRSFRACRIANAIFCTNCLNFAGSLVRNRINGTEVIADNFGLSPFFSGAVKINPRIENYILDINLFFGLEEWLPGLFLRVNAPITHTRWNLNLNECLRCESLISTTVCETLITTTVPSCPVPVCANSGPIVPLESSAIYPNLRLALSGDFLFGDMKTPWKYGRFSFCPLDDTAIADIDVMLGINFWDNFWFNNAFYFKVVIPTGTKIKSRNIFEPVIGNGRHAEFGIGFASHFNLLGDPCNTYQTLGLYIEGNITHMFKSHQKRSFDFFCNGLLSRYLILKEFASDGVTYAGNLINAINYNTRDCFVRIDAKGELAIKLAYRNDSWCIDVGYDVYGRTREKVCIETDCPCDLQRRRFGIKGDSGVCAREFSVIDSTLGSLIATLPLNSTESNSTIFAPGTIDNPTPITPIIPGNIVITGSSPQEMSTPLTRVTIAQSSMPPVLVKCCDLDPNSAANCSILTHKLFTFISYIWFDTCWEPYVGVGAEIEFAGKGPQALNQWSVMFKTGLNF